MTGTSVFEGLLRPLSESAPCGLSREDTPTLAAFDAYKLFGQQSTIGTRRPGQKEDEPPTPPAWDEMLDKSLAALQTTKDLRVLAYFAAAHLWTGGGVAFFESLRGAGARPGALVCGGLSRAGAGHFFFPQPPHHFHQPPSL